MKLVFVVLFCALSVLSAVGLPSVLMPAHHTNSTRYTLVDKPPPSARYSEGLQKTDYFKTPNGHALRYTTFIPAETSVYAKPLTVLLLHGRATFIEYYEPLILPLLERGVRVITYDLEGQGLSTRLLENPKKGYIDSFQTYLENLHAFISDCVQKEEGAFMLMGYSLGGHIALRYLQEHPNAADGAFVLSPMLGIPVDWVSKTLVHLLYYAGFDESFVPNANEISFALRMRFEENDYTRDPDRFRDIQKLINHFENHAIGGTTFGWTKNAFDSCQLLLNKADTFKTPTYILLGGGDSIIETTAAETFCKQASACRYKIIEGAYHELFREDANTQATLWKAFDTFSYRLLHEQP
jgi:lysophospholipase